MKTNLAEGLKILRASYRDLAHECNLSQTAVYHLIRREYAPQSITRLKVESALNLLRNYEIEICYKRIEDLNERIKLLKELEIEF